jgi:hypothetical protein
MTLPSLADVMIVITLLLPGFISLILFRRISVLEKKISDLELVIWSLFISVLIYFIFGLFTGIKDIESFRDKILFSENLAILLGLSLIFGIIPSFIVKKGFRRSVVKGNCWNLSLKNASKKISYVLVYTKDGLEYKGQLHYSGGEETPQEITIRKPKLILRDKNWKVLREIEMGKEILFRESDIKRIVFFNEV